MPIELKTERSCLGDLLFVYTNVLLLNTLSNSQHGYWCKMVTLCTTPLPHFTQIDICKINSLIIVGELKICCQFYD